MEREISSRDNPLIKQYVRLAYARAARRDEGLFVTEGAKLTSEAAASGYQAVQIFATEQALEKYGDIVQPVALQSEAFTRITSSVADKLAQSVSPQGVFGVFRMLDNTRQTATIGEYGRYLLLCGLQDPGNLGTILRTAAALGADGVLCTPDCPDLFSPKVLRASMGGVFRLPAFAPATAQEQISLLQARGIRVYAAALNEQATALGAGMLGEGCAVVIGNEGAGLPESVSEACDGTLRLPMRPGSESLNAAMAAGIFLWEMTRV